MQIVNWIFAIALASWAGWTDHRTRRIPNWLTLPAFLTGFLFNSIFGRWHGAKTSLEGAGLALAVFLPFVLMRALGAGDWKLMAALGAWLGPNNIVLLMLGTVVVAGVMALVMVLKRGRLKETLKNIGMLLMTFATFGVRRNAITLDNPELLALPFGVATALATVMLFGIELAYQVVLKRG
jgi:prepilin peptidase CpaA